MQAIKKQFSGCSVITSRMLVIMVAGLGLFSAGAYAAEPVSLPHFNIHAAYVPGEVLVKFRSLPGQIGDQASDVAAAHAAIGAQTMEILPVVKVHRVRGTRKQSTQALMRYYAKRADVEYVEPNYIYTTQIIPNDPRFAEMWGLNNIGQTGGTADADVDGPEAWDKKTGSTAVTVAIIDTGVAYNHADLAANSWINPGEIAGNGIDDDRNGYVDDVRGWDFANNDNNPVDDQGHGTHTAGTVGAVGNNATGVTGVAWQVKIMPLKFLTANGGGSSIGAARAILYASAMGAKISNNSWGGGAYSQTIEDAIATANQRGMLFVVAAGNANANNDTTASYPCNSPQPNVLCVAATDHNDNKASFSSYGAVNVDLGAPGVSILSTVPTGRCSLCTSSGYRFLSGTSMATPHVAGAAALVLAQFPNFTPVDIKNRLMQTVDKVPSLAGRTVTEGRLNVNQALTSAAVATPITIVARGTPVNGIYPIMVVRIDGNVVGTFNVNSTVFANYDLSVNVTAATDHAIDIVFTNDGFAAPDDRNLIVQSLRVNATTFLPSMAGVTYDRGAGNAAFDGVDVLAGQEGMWWSGALRFTIPGNAF